MFSSATEDANGRIVVQDWDLTRFEANPIVLWNHGEGGSRWSDSVEVDEYFPIGRASNVRVEKGKLLGDITLASEKANPLAERVFQALKEDVLNAVSVGWFPSDVRYEVHDDVEVVVMSGNELIEISVVPIPANPEAVRASLFTRSRALAHQTKEPPMHLLATLLPLLTMASAATEEQVTARVAELSEVERTVRELTGAKTPAEARAAVVALAEKAKSYDTVQAQIVEERATARASRVATLLKSGRDALQLTPANEPGILKALCGDETGAKADPDALELLLKNMPAAANAKHAQTADDATAPTTARPTEREIKRAAKLGLSPEALAAERIKLQRELNGLADETDTDEEG